MEAERQQKSLGPSSVVTVLFQDSPNSLIQTIEARRTLFAGDQFSLFWNWDQPDAPLNRKWRSEYQLTNTGSSLSLCVAGDPRSGAIPYIRDLGFYEGPLSNPYRLDPHLLIALMTGPCRLPAGRVYPGTFAAFRGHISGEIEELTALSKQPGAAEVLAPRLEAALLAREEVQPD